MQSVAIRMSISGSFARCLSFLCFLQYGAKQVRMALKSFWNLDGIFKVVLRRRFLLPKQNAIPAVFWKACILL
jgi:hypothetical protein